MTKCGRVCMFDMELRSTWCCYTYSSRNVRKGPTPHQVTNNMPNVHGNELVPIIVGAEVVAQYSFGVRSTVRYWTILHMGDQCLLYFSIYFHQRVSVSIIRFSISNCLALKIVPRIYCCFWTCEDLLTHSSMYLDHYVVMISIREGLSAYKTP